MAGVNSVTARLAKAGHPEVSLYRGRGYHYFIFDSGEIYECESHMVPYFRDFPIERWVEDGLDFAQRIKKGKSA